MNEAVIVLLEGDNPVASTKIVNAKIKPCGEATICLEMTGFSKVDTVELTLRKPDGSVSTNKCRIKFR